MCLVLTCWYAVQILSCATKLINLYNIFTVTPFCDRHENRQVQFNIFKFDWLILYHFDIAMVIYFEFIPGLLLVNYLWKKKALEKSYSVCNLWTYFGFICGIFIPICCCWILSLDCYLQWWVKKTSLKSFIKASIGISKVFGIIA